MKDTRIKSVPQERKASGTNNCPYRYTHKHKASKWV